MPENITQTVELEAALSPDYEKAFKSAQSMVDGLDKELGQLGKREQKLTELQSMRAKITKATAEGNVKEAKKLQSQYDRLASSLGVAGQDAKGLERELDALRRRQQELAQQRQPFADQLAMRRAANDVARLRANYDRFRDPRVGRQLQLAEQRARDLGVTMRRSAGPLRNAAGNLRNMGMQSLESLPGMNKIAQVFGKLPPQAMVVTAAVVGTTAAIVGLGKAGLNTAKEMTSSLDELAKNSRALGINVESYQRLSYAMRRGGASDEQFSTALQTLTKRMDDIVDYMEAAASRLDLFAVEEMRPEAQRLAQITVQVVGELAKILDRLPNFKKDPSVMELALGVDVIEDEGDAVYKTALADLFREGVATLEIMKWSRIFDRMELAIDACEHACDIVQGVVMKNA
jgi:chromosome segregation ATPase